MLRPSSTAAGWDGSAPRGHGAPGGRVGRPYTHGYASTGGNRPGGGAAGGGPARAAPGAGRAPYRVRERYINLRPIYNNISAPREPGIAMMYDL